MIHSKNVAIGITETKINGTIFDAEIYIEGYRVVRCDRDKKDRCVACYMKHGICFSTENILPKSIEVIFEDLLLPKTKPILEYHHLKNFLLIEIYVLFL